MSEIGERRRLSQLVPDRPCIYLPLDGGLIDGPRHMLVEPKDLLTDECLAEVDVVIGFRGLLKRLEKALSASNFVLNLNASTVLSMHTRKSMVSTVRTAVAVGAQGVAFHLNVSDATEGEALHHLGEVVEEASIYGMPVLVIAYPRRSGENGEDDNYEALRIRSPEAYTALVTHTVRIAVEMGAHIVKTVYPGSVSGMREVIASGCGVPVVIAGGRVTTDSEAFDKARSAIEAGAAGVAFGRQVFLNPRPASFVRQLRKVMVGALTDRAVGGPPQINQLRRAE
jgi:DhnA family fructose-bisphosphate aldolase class Ia